MKPTEDGSTGETFRPLGPVVRADEAEKWFSAAAYLAEARRQGDKIVAQARVASEEERRRGFEAGRLSGVEEAARLIAEMKTGLNAFVAGLRDDLIELVVQIVREILDEYEPGELAARAVVKAIEQVRTASELTVLAAPEEAESIRLRLGELLKVDGLLNVVPDPLVAPGRCVLWSEFGQLDVSAEAQLEQLAMALRLGVEEAQP